MTTSLDQITDFPALVEYLRDELDWPIPADISLDEATYDVSPEEIGLKSAVVGGGIEIKQLRPLNRAQPWGVFFLNLPSAKLPVTLVRNILGKLAVKKRASANKSEQAAFAKHDLLFIAATGSASDRRLAFAHFADDEVKGDAATLKVLGWDADDTPRRLGLTEASLKTKLHWPDNPADADHWRKQWGEAFAHSDTRTVVRDSKAMAQALAALARRIRARAEELIKAQTDQGSLVLLHKAFKEALIHDLTPDGFADTYAQTIAYGLLSTAISRASGALVQDDMTANVAGTSPFLKEMLGTFIEAGGRRTGKANAGLDFDELGITEVVDLMRNADMEAVLADFDRKNPDEDPVIHFYELFLKEYDAAQKVKRGVFYTPRPVVSFIVRSVDEVLRTEFGLEDGLASTATWGQVIAASKGKDGAEIVLPDGAKESDPFVRLLDPATGTGTFLVECVDLIHATMVAKWKTAGKRDAEVKALWNDYVPKHLLTRLTGFELMMAPYAIAHVKLGLKLADTGYTFGSDARAQIYLTNALEPAQDLDMQLAFMSEALAHEARAANEAKEARFTAVVGNPPYSVLSSNNHPWIRKLIDDYRQIDGEALGERNSQSLQDDYVKFLRSASEAISQSNVGVISMITPHGYLDNPTFRGMRRHLDKSHNLLIFTDLHGNVNKKEQSPDGSKDENVFDIQQGTAICVLAQTCSSRAAPSYSELWGNRDKKYLALSKNTAATLPAKVTSNQPALFLFVPRDEERTGEFEAWPPITKLIPVWNNGFMTSRDAFVFDLDAAALARRIEDFRTTTDLAAYCKAHSLRDVRENTIQKSQELVRLMPDPSSHIVRALYRPFDERPLFYDGSLVRWPVKTLMQNLLGVQNVAMVTSRMTKGEQFAHLMAAQSPVEKISLSSKTSNNAYVFPLWLMPQGTETRTLPNIDAAFAKRVAILTGLAWDDCVEGPKQAALAGIVKSKPEQTAMFAGPRRERGEPGKSFGPRDLFDYIYAILHSPAYRARYADYLKSDFARIPLPGSRDLFEALVPIGTELVALHLLDADALPALKDPKSIRLAGNGKAQVTMPAARFENDAYKGGRMYIAADRSRWFETVPVEAADFHIGGYQPARKWLKDRAQRGGKKASDGRVLTDDDILHYRRMITALTRTAELMPKIDEVIAKHGGWPDAFKGMTEEVAG